MWIRIETKYELSTMWIRIETKNEERVKEYQKKYSKEHRGKKNLYKRKYYQKNKEDYRKYNPAYCLTKIKDPVIRVYYVYTILYQEQS